MNLKNGEVFTSKFVGTGPSSYGKRTYRAAVSHRLRDTVLWNPKIHNRIHKSPPPVPLLSQIDSVPASISHFLKIHLNIILPSKTGSSKWAISFRFAHQNPVYTSPTPHMWYMPRPPDRFTDDTLTKKYNPIYFLKKLICLLLVGEGGQQEIHHTPVRISYKANETIRG